MPKLDLSRASSIKSASGEVSALKGSGFSWAKSAGPVGSNTFSYIPEATLAPFTSRWDSRVIWSFDGGTSPVSMVVSETSNLATWGFHSLDVLGGVGLSDVSDVDLVVQFSGTKDIGIAARASGADHSENGYTMGIIDVGGRRKFRSSHLDNGARTTTTFGSLEGKGPMPTATGTYNMRLNFSGSPAVISGRVWLDGIAEPTGWDAQYTISGGDPVFATGRFGLFTQSGANQHNVYFIGVGLNGESAPIPA